MPPAGLRKHSQKTWITLKPSEQPTKKTVVIGASENTSRYASLAVQRLHSHGHEVIPVGLHEGTIFGIPILAGNPHIENVDTVSLYIRPEIQKTLFDYILSLKPKRIIFNPGAENPEFEEMAQKQGIETEEACTLVMLSIGNF